MERFGGRAALVTGAASGIGAAVSRRLVSFGMTVYGCDSDGDGLAKLNEEMAPIKPETEKLGDGLLRGRFVPTRCDLRREDEIATVLREIKEKSGTVAVGVMCAGVGHKATLLDGQGSAFRDMFEVNVLGTVLCAQGCVKLMREAEIDDGHLVLINSTAGHSVRVGRPDYADFNFYNATKYALTAVTEGLRFELRLAKSKIRVSQISPGLVESKFTHSMYPDLGPIIDMLYRCAVSLKPDDVADAVIHALDRPPRVQIHDILIAGNGPDRPADWEKKVKAMEAKET